MNRRQFIAGLMASTVAPAPPVPILKPRSIGASFGQSLWFDAAAAQRGIAIFQGYIGEYSGIVIRQIEPKDFYLNGPGI